MLETTHTPNYRNVLRWIIFLPISFLFASLSTIAFRYIYRFILQLINILFLDGNVGNTKEIILSDLLFFKIFENVVCGLLMGVIFITTSIYIIPKINKRIILFVILGVFIFYLAIYMVFWSSYKWDKDWESFILQIFMFLGMYIKYKRYE